MKGRESAGRTRHIFRPSGSTSTARAASALVSSGHAYRCYCKPEDLKAKRDAAQSDRWCLALRPYVPQLSDADRAAREAAGLPSAVRFNVPDGGRTTFHDLVHGDIEVDHVNIEDFVVLRSDGNPTYHLSVVVDDVEMEITHVVRGDDHISNTPKQVLLYQAMKAKVPAFAHVPLILGPDKKRLSKRHGATSVGEYERLGYLPEAMVNFLALLGWSPGGDQELFTRDELVGGFRSRASAAGTPSSTRRSSTGSISSTSLRLPGEEILSRLGPDLAAAGLTDDALCRPRADHRRDRSREAARQTASRLRRSAAVSFGGSVETRAPWQNTSRDPILAPSGGAREAGSPIFRRSIQRPEATLR